MAAEILDHRTAEPSRPEAAEKADFAFWATVACWTPDEAAMLSLGLDPEIREPPVVPVSAQQDSIPYRQRRLLILRAIEAGQLRNPLTPLTFVEWAKQYGIQIPEGIRLAVIDHDHRHSKAVADDTCNAKVVASMQKMILGMAKGGYGYNPADLRSPVVPDIVRDLDEIGISLSENTIRSRLGEANDRYGSQSVDDARRA